MAAAVSVAAVAGCSDGSDDAGASSFEARLELIPASADLDGEDDAVTVAMSDLERAAELAGLEPPDDPSSGDAVVDYLSPLSGFDLSGEEPLPVAALFPEASQYQRAAGELDAFVDEVGWSLLDVSWFVEYQVPPGLFTVMGGDFDEDQLTEAMGEPADDIWRLGEEGENGTVGRDPELPSSAARPLGESLRLALDDDRLIVGRVTQPVEDALEGSDDTLADDPVLSALAGALDDEDVYSAMLMTGRDFNVVSTMPPGSPEAVAAAEEEALPEEFNGVAGGLSYEDDHAVAVLVYTHADEEAAASNADALEGLIEDGRSLQSGRPWSELFSVDEVRTNGTTVVARLDIPTDRPAAQVFSMLQAQDSLVSHS